MLKAILARVASAGTLANPFAAIPGGKAALPARSRPRNLASLLRWETGIRRCSCQ